MITTAGFYCHPANGVKAWKGKTCHQSWRQLCAVLLLLVRWLLDCDRTGRLMSGLTGGRNLTVTLSLSPSSLSTDHRSITQTSDHTQSEMTSLPSCRIMRISVSATSTNSDNKNPEYITRACQQYLVKCHIIVREIAFKRLCRGK